MRHRSHGDALFYHKAECHRETVRLLLTGDGDERPERAVDEREDVGLALEHDVRDDERRDPAAERGRHRRAGRLRRQAPAVLRQAVGAQEEHWVLIAFQWTDELHTFPS